MPVVEFLGPPGSGKSTLAAQLPALVPGSRSLPEAVRSALAHRGSDAITRAVARLARSAESRMWDAAYARSTDRFSALSRFTAARPETVDAVVEAQRSRVDRDLAPEVVLDWVLNLMARYQLATEGDPGGCLVIDEGFAQRGVALFAAGFDESADTVALQAYLEAAPRPDFLVVVETPLDVCADRLDRGAWSERLRGRSDAEKARFLESAGTLTGLIATRLEGSGARAIWVSGTTPPLDSLSLAAATLRADC